MKLTIPELKTKLKLTEDWTFSLFVEYRNSTLFNYIINNGLFDETKVIPTLERIMYFWNFADTEEGKKIMQEHFMPSIWEKNRDVKKCYQMTLPKDTVLVIDRYYIRNGGEQFSSLTFRINESPLIPKKKAKPRFWAKLYDVNNINFTPL